ncbi:MAG TPA: hypothetical protein VFU39_02445 [Sulfuricaulis sp.]|nr:hypothetical protein [Sulfuricaulis sp.]
MELFVLLIVAMAAIAAFLWYRKKSSAPTEATSPSNRFHGVTIKFRADACPAVRMYESTRFLAKEAPRLPLENCTAPRCHCRYEHYDDRRTEDRRDSSEETKFEGAQRRERKDRRKG